MSNELQFPYVSSGVTIDVFIRNYAAQIWHTGSNSFVAYDVSSRPSCKIPLSEQGSSKYYVGDFPTAITGGFYYMEVFQRLGATPAESDVRVGQGLIHWDSTGVIGLNKPPVNIVQVTGSPIVPNVVVDANIIRVSGLDVNLDTVQQLPTGQFAYYADIRIERDTTNAKDEYTVQWFKNATPLTSGQITSPTIQVIKRSDGTDLVASVAMSYISVNIGTVKYDEATNKISVGEPYIVKVSATIDGVTKTSHKIIGRDG